MKKMPHLIGKKLDVARTLVIAAGYTLRVCSDVDTVIVKNALQMNRINVEVSGKVPNQIIKRQEIG